MRMKGGGAGLGNISKGSTPGMVESVTPVHSPPC